VKNSPPASVGSFVLRILAWLAPCFALWHFSAPYYGMLVGRLARLLVDSLHPGLVEAVERSGAELAFVTTLAHSVGGRDAVLAPEVNPMVYTFGLAFFVALMLAARASPGRVLAGAALLMPFQAWGVAFDFLAQVGVRLGPEISRQAGFSDTGRELIALGYQAGSLIFPTLVPVLAWAAFNRGFIQTVLPREPVPA
jgi:hypothetical protein